MGNFNTNRGQGWPNTGEDRLIEKDPMIVKVPFDNVDFGSRKGVMSRARSAEHTGERRLGIKHVDGKSGTA